MGLLIGEMIMRCVYESKNAEKKEQSIKIREGRGREARKEMDGDRMRVRASKGK